MIKNMYMNPKLSSFNTSGEVCNMNEGEMQEHFDAFFDEIYTELEDSYGEIDEMIICDNLGEHLCGNVFCMFKDEDDAFKCVRALNDRWVDGRPIQAELCPITDFRDACCRQYEFGDCNRGGLCNFMHIKPISREMRKELHRRYKRKKREDKKFRDDTASGDKGGYAGGFGGWSGIGDDYWDRDHGFLGRQSTQSASKRKLDRIDNLLYGGGNQGGGNQGGNHGGNHDRNQGGDQSRGAHRNVDDRSRERAASQRPR